MDYDIIANVYSALDNASGGLNKTTILGEFLEKIKGKYEYIYLLQGRIFADYDPRELGMSAQLVIKAISKASGFGEDRIMEEFKRVGDLGEIAYDLVGKHKKQAALFVKKLTVEKVIGNFRKISELEGKGVVSTKIDLVVELLLLASALEAKFLVRNVLGDLRIGVGVGILRDSIVKCCFHPVDSEEKKNYGSEVQGAYDLATDWAVVFEKSCSDKLSDIKLSPGRPVKVMLYPKVKSAEEALRIVGSPAAFEYKCDGFRMMINKDDNGNVKLFTRRLEDVSLQFPEVVEFVKTHIDAKSFIIDSEAIGYDRKTKKYTDFQAISQRIRRKYDIDKLVEKLPVELRVFDVIYLDGENLINKGYEERRGILVGLVKEEEFKVGLAKRIVTDNIDEANEYFAKALSDNQEGLMVKGLDKKYKPGARVGYGVKWKPVDSDFDLVITGAEWGNGKRVGWLTSFDVACRGYDGELLDIGKVGNGIKELEQNVDSDDISFESLTTILKELVTSEDGKHVIVKPEVVVTVQFQNVQKSPTYSSGYALRFPRITRLRPDRSIENIVSVEEIKKEC